MCLSVQIPGTVLSSALAAVVNDHLGELLNLLSRLDHAAAVRIAVELQDYTLEPYSAPHNIRAQKVIWDFLYDQTAFPHCEYCDWPVLPEDFHEYCNEQLQQAATTVDEDDVQAWIGTEADDQAGQDPNDDYDGSDGSDDDTFDGSEKEDICEGCGQGNSCTCAELASYQAFQADPTTRGSFWTP